MRPSVSSAKAFWWCSDSPLHETSFVLSDRRGRKDERINRKRESGRGIKIQWSSNFHFFDTNNYLYQSLDRLYIFHLIFYFFSVALFNIHVYIYMKYKYNNTVILVPFDRMLSFLFFIYFSPFFFLLFSFLFFFFLSLLYFSFYFISFELIHNFGLSCVVEVGTLLYGGGQWNNSV